MFLTLPETAISVWAANGNAEHLTLPGTVFSKLFH
jgi:hypothetical protein